MCRAGISNSIYLGRVWMRLGHIWFSARKVLIKTSQCSQISSFLCKDGGQKLSSCSPQLSRDFKTPGVEETFQLIQCDLRHVYVFSKFSSSTGFSLAILYIFIYISIYVYIYMLFWIYLYIYIYYPSYFAYIYTCT